MGNKYLMLDCEFDFQCPKKWSKLEKTPFSNIRYCDKCNQSVYLCKTQEQADWVAENRLCGAVRVELGEMLMGLIIEPEDVGAKRELTRPFELDE